MSGNFKGDLIFLCEESCHNTKDAEGWRGGMEYTFNAEQVNHLFDIGHLKRFKPLNGPAFAHYNALMASIKKEKTLKDMSLSELKAIAEAKGLALADTVTRNEAIEILSQADTIPEGDKPLEDLTLLELKKVAASKGVELPKNAKKAEIIVLLTEKQE